ncbi:D-alanyl-D-alanine endopeptidase [Aeromonas cavernicola]|uniref:D-alanyl-D-alanine endopeptidase n=2 Tax=Aeromonas cavernicola TaxID=1006623 RepID=A0A2H9U434_9GAMM|nr:D-alanyl-D-alanine endopeptidase [Aeromonas cavernicola]PJG58739.1 D-alanyl-D-alanine endopeptidase [Aeromonas cavernicola]
MKMPSLFALLIAAAMLTPSFINSAYAKTFSASQSGFIEKSHTTGHVTGLSAASFVVANHRTGEVLSARNSQRVMPIASLTKLMTALVVLDANLRLNEMLTISKADIDRLKGTGSRLAIGSRLSRAEMLHIALMSSENRAASALARHYPGGQRAFVEAMNAKARMLGMWNTRYADSTGLNPRNVSTAQDLAKLAVAAAAYPLIRQYSTDDQSYVRTNKRQLHYRNSNRLIREGEWEFTLSKTGYIREAGRCLVLGTKVGNEPVIMVLLNAPTTNDRAADAKRIKTWLESSGRTTVAAN